MIELTRQVVKSLIVPRKRDSHKFTYGHVLIIAGSKYYTGAAIFSANSAIKSGAGLVTLAFPRSLGNWICPKLLPEVITLPLEDNNRGFFNKKNVDELLKHISERKVTSIAVGPGLSTEEGVKDFFKRLIPNLNLPVVIDADGINILAEETISFKIPYKNTRNFIITPHLGEFSRLVKQDIKAIKKQKVQLARKISLENDNLVCVLKSYETIITNGILTYRNIIGTAGMAKGGSGDVLTGMIAALVKQVKKEEKLNASVVGVYVHGLAGVMASRTKTQISMLPTDIIEQIPNAFKRVI